jgi:hypothetical protein
VLAALEKAVSLRTSAEQGMDIPGFLRVADDVHPLPAQLPRCLLPPLLTQKREGKSQWRSSLTVPDPATLGLLRPAVGGVNVLMMHSQTPRFSPETGLFWEDR